MTTGIDSFMCSLRLWVVILLNDQLPVCKPVSDKSYNPHELTGINLVLQYDNTNQKEIHRVHMINLLSNCRWYSYVSTKPYVCATSLGLLSTRKYTVGYVDENRLRCGQSAIRIQEQMTTRFLIVNPKIRVSFLPPDYVKKIMVN